MQKVLHETCEQYVARRLSEGWKIISQVGLNVILQSPEGIIRPVDLRNDTLTLRPSAAGASTKLTPSAGANWECVDETPADDDATYVYATLQLSSALDLYALPNHTTESGAINYVKVYADCKKVANGGTLKVKVAITSLYMSAYLTLTTSYASYTYQCDVNPTTTVAWTWTDIDALQAGIKLYETANVQGSARCTQVYVEVDYTLFLPSRSFYPNILAH